MKKLYIILLIFGFLSSVMFADNASVNSQESINILENDMVVSFVRSSKAMLLSAPVKVNTAFNWTVERIDNILTKKGVIKALLVLGSLFSVYCYFFPPDPVKYVIEKIVQSAVSGASDVAISTIDGLDDPKVAIALQRVTQKMGELQGVYNINQEIGQTAGLWQGMWRSPFETTGLLVSKGLEKGMTVGLPFVLGLFAKKLLKVK